VSAGAFTVPANPAGRGGGGSSALAGTLGPVPDVPGRVTANTAAGLERAGAACRLRALYQPQARGVGRDPSGHVRNRPESAGQRRRPAAASSAGFAGTVNAPALTTCASVIAVLARGTDASFSHAEEACGARAARWPLPARAPSSGPTRTHGNSSCRRRRFGGAARHIETRLPARPQPKLCAESGSVLLGQ